MCRVAAVLCVLTVALAACDDSEPSGAPTEPPASTLGDATATTRSATPTTSSPATTAAPATTAGGSGSPCPPTSGDATTDATVTLGPAEGIPPTDALGDPLVIIGTVYDADCVAQADVQLRVWQTDGAGRYGPGHDSDELECCYLQGTVQTDAAGRYQLVTSRPAHYEGVPRPPPAHIHVEIASTTGPGAMTEIVFADDPRLPDGATDGYVVVELAAGSAADAPLEGVADIVLGG